MDWKTAVSLLILSNVALAQEYVADGGFDQPLIFNWQTGGGGVNPRIQTYGVWSATPDRCFAIQGNQTVATLEQDVSVPPTTVVLIRCDYASERIVNATIGISVREGTSWNQVVSSGSLSSLGPRRASLSAVYTVQASTNRIRIEFRDPGQQGTFYVDNVSMTPGRTPTFVTNSARAINSNVIVRFSGEPGSQFQMYASPLISASPITLAGWAGQWWLDPLTQEHWFDGGLTASGSLSLTLPVPNTPAIAGIPIYFQGLSARRDSAGSLVFEFGSEARYAFF